MTVVVIMSLCAACLPYRHSGHVTVHLRHSRHCRRFDRLQARQRRYTAALRIQHSYRLHFSRQILSSVQRVSAATTIQSSLRFHNSRHNFSKAALAYITRVQSRAKTQVTAAWRGFWQRKTYLTGLKRGFARERRMNANVVFRNWSVHLVRAVMKIVGRRMLKALVVDQVLSFYIWGFVFSFMTRACRCRCCSAAGVAARRGGGCSTRAAGAMGSGWWGGGRAGSARRVTCDV